VKQRHSVKLRNDFLNIAFFKFLKIHTRSPYQIQRKQEKLLKKYWRSLKKRSGKRSLFLKIDDWGFSLGGNEFYDEQCEKKS